MAHSVNNGEVKINLGLKAAMGDSNYRPAKFLSRQEERNPTRARKSILK
jgi:hypothetical protein